VSHGRRGTLPVNFGQPRFTFVACGASWDRADVAFNGANLITRLWSLGWIDPQASAAKSLTWHGAAVVRRNSLRYRSHNRLYDLEGLNEKK
jgi:hypothetical protein